MTQGHVQGGRGVPRHGHEGEGQMELQQRLCRVSRVATRQGQRYATQCTSCDDCLAQCCCPLHACIALMIQPCENAHRWYEQHAIGLFPITELLALPTVSDVVAAMPFACKIDRSA